jgi:transcriptional regulator with XRE-family HTH domain
MIFGELLKRFREERKLSLRELGKLADTDHAHLYRLETGAKESPSSELLTTLSRTLKLDARRSHIFRFMVGRSTDERLIDLILENQDIPLVDFESAAKMSFRGKRPNSKEAWLKVIKQIREIREEVERDG